MSNSAEYNEVSALLYWPRKTLISLGNLCQCSVTHSKRVSPGVQVEPLVFQFEPIASCLVTEHH